MPIFNKIILKALIAFVFLLGPQGIANAQVQLGSNNCQIPSSVTIRNQFYFASLLTVTDVNGVSYVNKSGYAVNCDLPSHIGKTQWVVFYMKGTDYFKKDYAIRDVGDHAGFMARASFPAQDRFRGIGPMFSPGWGTIGEIYNNTGDGTAQGCQAISGTYPTNRTVIGCPTNGRSPSQELAYDITMYPVDYWRSANVANINNLPMVDDYVYQIVVHANHNSMSYSVTNISTGQVANGWISQTIDNKTASYTTQGGIGFFRIDNTLNPNKYASTKVEYWGIQSGWF